MTDIHDKVWYACYGSNILEERFLCYIKGGQPIGAATKYKGCRDTRLPTDSEEFYISSELYFARNSQNWGNGGVAFIRTKFEPQASTMGRIYLITKGQFVDIAKQESNTNAELILDFEKALKEGSFMIEPSLWYGNLLYLGQHYNYPIFTLTNENDLQAFTKPGKDYLQTIIKGIKQAHHLDDKTIFDYLKTKKGIHSNYSEKELWDIFNQ